MDRQAVAKGDEGEIRGRLLDVTIGLFAEKGYAATSVREIVREAGVTAPVLYYYFKNKEGLYLEIMSEALAAFRAMLGEAERQGGPASERLVNLGRGMLSLFRQDPRVARIVYAVFYGPPQGTPAFDFDEFHNGMVGTVTKLVEEGIAGGEFTGGDVEAKTWAVLGAIHIMMEGELCRPECSGGAEGLAAIMNVVFTGMRKC